MIVFYIVKGVSASVELMEQQMGEIRAGGAKIVWKKMLSLGVRSLVLFNKRLALLLLERRESSPDVCLIPDSITIRLVAFILSGVKDNGCTPMDAEEATKMVARLYPLLASRLDRNPECQDALKAIIQSSLLLGKVTEWAEYSSMQYLAKCRPGGSGYQEVHKKYFINNASMRNLGFACHWDGLIKARILHMVPDATFVLGYNSDSTVANSHFVTRYLSDFVEFCEPNELGARGAYLPDPITLGDTLFAHNLAGLAFVQQHWDSFGLGPVFQLKPDDEEFGREELVRLGIPVDAWFATVHARSSAFKNVEQFRDADVYTFLDAARLIIDAGGWVVRIGSANEPPIEPMEGLVDYARSPRKSPRMDIFLMAGASLFVGTSSGPVAIAEAFGVPVVLTNLLPSSSLFFSRQTLFIPRVLQYLDGNGHVPFHLSFSAPLNMGVCDMNYLQNGVVPLPNTSNEISGIVEQALRENRLTASGKGSGATWGSQQNPASQAAQERQDRFKRLCLQNNTLFLPDKIAPFAPLARMGDSFLEQHEELLN